MVFSSSIFLFAFLPIVFIVNRFLPLKVSNVFLCLASLMFYAWGEPVYVILMLFSVLMNYTFSRFMGNKKRKKLMLIMAIALNLAMLFVFKYADFAVDTVNGFFGIAVPMPNILLPIGISFFTFQALSYTIDVYREVTPPQKSYMKLLLYISFFPQLIAGPIVKYHDIAEQIDARTVSFQKSAFGIRRFVIGLAKKVLIANTLAMTVDTVFALSPSELNLPISWIVAIAYTLQLYFDFSGYSDMAIGLGQMFGFDFKENFNYPYVSGSIRDFWRRWHISLSTWFKEYVYIPLGGNRKGRARTSINKLIVFFLTGLWHGAEWTFVAWGLMHGLFLFLEEFNIIPVDRLGKKTRWIGHIYTLLVVIFAYVLFRAESFEMAMGVWGNMFAGSLDLGYTAKLLTPLMWTALALGIVGSVPWVRGLKGKLEHNNLALANGISYCCVFVLLALCMMSLASSTHNPFIYFRF